MHYSLLTHGSCIPSRPNVRLQKSALPMQRLFLHWDYRYFFSHSPKQKMTFPVGTLPTSSIGALATSLVIGSIMSGGISLLILSLHTLFGIDVSYKCYLYILTLCNVCLALFLFLGFLPQGKEKHNDRPLPNAFLNSIIHYLFLPLETQ